jgi:hypothetical protein
LQISGKWKHIAWISHPAHIHQLVAKHVGLLMPGYSMRRRRANHLISGASAAALPKLELSQILNVVLDSVREVNASRDDVSNDQRKVWQRVVEWIETMRSDCDDKKITIRGKWQYDAKFLLRCLVSAWHLKLTRRGGRGHNVLRSHLGDAISIFFQTA